MSTSALLNRWLNRTYKCLAILLVTFAVIISAMRLFLPYAHNYRIELQEYINTQFQTDIHIAALTMDWEKSGPVLVAENVELINTDAVKTVLGRLNIELDFWQSVRHQNFITKNIILDDVHVYVNKDQWEQSKDNSSGLKQAELIENISELFLLQINHFSLENSHFTLRERGVDKVFSIAHFNWLNADNRHQGSGDVILHGLTSDKLKLLVDLQGGELDTLSGEIYLEAKRLNIAPWLDKKLMVKLDDISSDINFSAWGHVAKGQVNSLNLVFLPSVVQWQINEKEQTFELSKGQVLVSKITPELFEIQTSPLSMLVNETTIQPVELDIRSQLNGFTSVYLSHLDIAALSQIAPLFIADEASRTLLAQLQPSGSVNELYWRTNGKTQAASLQFKDIGFNYSQGIPGISNLQGELVINNQQFAGYLNTAHSALDFNEHFKQAIPFTRLASQLDGYWNDKGVQFNAKELAFESTAAELTATLGVTIPTDGSPEMALFAQIHRGEVVQASLFYPHLLMGEDLVDYLNDAIVSGDMSQAQVLFNGPLDAFPFLDNEGVFVVDAELSRAKFSFDSEWPAITNLAANLNFTNNSMLITAREGRLSGLDVQGVTAAINDLENEQILVVNAAVKQQSPANVSTLMQASPLRTTVGETLSQLVVTQPISADFSLSLPLNDVDAAVASGLITFVNNNLALKTPAMNFTKVNGQLAFTNEVLKANNLELEWLGLPLSLQLNAADGENHYQTDIKLLGNWQQTKWQPFLPPLLSQYASGDVNWVGDLVLNMHHDGGFSYTLSLDSDLHNTQLNLPAPYSKALGDSLALVAKVDGQQHQSTLNVNLGEELSFYGVLDHNDVQFSRAHLMLGNEQMLLPMDGFHITTKLAQADFSVWQPFIQDIVDSLPAGDKVSTPLLERPERIRGNINQAYVLGESLTNVSFNLLDQEHWWLLQLNAKEARAEVKFYPDWYQQGIDINADFINLRIPEPVVEPVLAQSEAALEAAHDAQSVDTQTPSTEVPMMSAEETASLFSSIPPIKFQCAQCQIGLLDLGHLSFDINRKDATTLVMENVKASRSKTKLSFDATWQFEKEVKSVMSVVGDLSIKDIEQEVEKFGFASLIKDSGANSHFGLNWQGGPHEFSLAKLNGDVSVELDDGYLVDVSDSGVRILSILSLQSLVRKLTLDFRDIFSDGMFYSSIKGDMHIRDGIFYTDNTRMNGAAGDLTIKGNTELTKGLLDYRMSYKPNLTSSLPVLAWIATLNPVTFLAGVAIDEVFTSKVVSEFNFELTGTVNEPDLKEVNRKSRDVSVGRSTPPQFVEHAADNGEAQELPQNDNPPLPHANDKQDKSDG